MTLLEVGRVVKPHGLKGELVVELVTNRLERVAAPGTHLTGETAHGRIDLEIATSRPFQGRYLVYFTGVADREGVEALRDVRLLAEPAPDPDAFYVHELIGCELFDQAGTRRGAITSVEANPASDLLVVDGKFYVPARFVVARSPGRVDVEVPEGLFDV